MSTSSLRDVETPEETVSENEGGHEIKADSLPPQINDMECDSSDFEPPSIRSIKFGLLLNRMSNLLFLVDVVTDLYTAYVLCSNSFWVYSLLTLMFILVPGAASSKLVFLWYGNDDKWKPDNMINSPTKVSKTEKILTLFHMAPLVQSLKALVWGRKTLNAKNPEDKKNYFKLYANENEKSFGLKMIEAFLESAPQATLQIYILVRHFNDEVDRPYNNTFLQSTFIGISLLSLSVTAASHNRCLSTWNNILKGGGFPIISWWGTILLFFCFLCGVSSRVFALAMCAATSFFLLLSVYIFHVLLMYVVCVSLYNRPKIPHPKLFSILLAFASVFSFYVYDELPGRNQKMGFYYILCFMENTVLLLIWFFCSDPTSQHTSFRVTGLVGHYILFFIGLSLMFLYYKYFHLRNLKWIEITEEDKQREIFSVYYQELLRNNKGLLKDQAQCTSNTQLSNCEESDAMPDGEPSEEIKSNGEM